MRRNKQDEIFDFETEFDDDAELGTIYVHASGRVTAYYPATMYQKNGDPGDPAEGGEVEFDELSATNDAGEEIDVPEKYVDAIEEMARERAYTRD